MHNADAVHALERDLRTIFDTRLHSLVVYGEGTAAPQVNTLAVVADLDAADLARCAARLGAWHDRGLATPLLLERGEFEASLDAFPFEFGAILADHTVVSGPNPFDGLVPDPADLRRACEVQARSHLLHLREGYIETAGDVLQVADLIVHSAPALAALLRNITRMAHAPVPGAALARVAELARGGTISGDEAQRVMPPYLGEMRSLVEALDRWSAQ